MNNITKGIILVATGAASYGAVATFIKLGIEDGFSTAELTFSQGFMGFVSLLLINIFAKKAKGGPGLLTPTVKDRFKLMAGGISLGLTSTFYYLSLSSVSVSVCIVMLMQSVWMGSLLDLIVKKTKPSKEKIIAIVIVLIGTVFTTNLLDSEIEINIEGVLWGLLAAVSYTFTLFSSNRIATKYPPLIRSFYMIAGSICVVTLVWGHSLLQQFDINVLWRWGLLLSFFGTVIPPLFFTKGMPLIGVGLGSIVASTELPITVLVAWIVLCEQVLLIQWFGIVLILLAVIVMNLALFKK